MKKALSIVLWLFSIVLGFMALALLSSSALSSAMLIGCAVLINPVFLEKIQLKKSLTALLAIGLFIGSVAAFPATHQEPAATAEQSALSNKSVVEETQQPDELVRSVNAEAAPSSNGEEIVRFTEDPQTPTPTVLPTATPTPKPTPTPTPKPTPKPTKTPKPTTTPKPVTRSVGITIVDYSDSVRRGAYAFIKIQGMPNTEYDCEVQYKSGMSTAQGLGIKQSDRNGNVSWKWKVGTRTSLDYMPTIYIDGGGDSISVSFDVTK